MANICDYKHISCSSLLYLGWLIRNGDAHYQYFLYAQVIEGIDAETPIILALNLNLVIVIQKMRMVYVGYSDLYVFSLFLINHIYSTQIEQGIVDYAITHWTSAPSVSVTARSLSDVSPSSLVSSLLLLHPHGPLHPRLHL